MLENIILYLFLGIFLGLIVSILVSLLGKYLKGTLTIHIPKRHYNYGEKIEGNFTLKAKKHIDGNELVAHLIWYKKESVYSRGKRNNRSVEFARFTQHIESKISYEAWLKRDYDFSLQIPEYKDIFGEDATPQKSPHGALGMAAQYVTRHTKTHSHTWQIRVDLEAQGIDISGKRDIFITQKV